MGSEVILLEHYWATTGIEAIVAIDCCAKVAYVTSHEEHSWNVSVRQRVHIILFLAAKNETKIDLWTGI
jgi:hypothetical protein